MKRVPLHKIAYVALTILLLYACFNTLQIAREPDLSGTASLIINPTAEAAFWATILFLIWSFITVRYIFIKLRWFESVFWNKNRYLKIMFFVFISIILTVIFEIGFSAQVRQLVDKAKFGGL